MFHKKQGSKHYYPKIKNQGPGTSTSPCKLLRAVDLTRDGQTEWGLQEAKELTRDRKTVDEGTSKQVQTTYLRKTNMHENHRKPNFSAASFQTAKREKEPQSLAADR